MMRHLPNVIIDQKSKKIITQIPMPVINCLAIEGGGVRGAAYAGAFNRLEMYKLLDEIQHVAGSSVGSIAAMFVALGYSASEMKTELESIPMESFLEATKPWAITPNFFTTGKQILSVVMNKKAALSTGNRLFQWIEARVEKKVRKKDAKFSDLAKAIELQKTEGKTKFKYLYVTSTNISLTTPECEVFSHETKPAKEIARSVFMSCLFPYVFESVIEDGYNYLDGGLRQNLPAKFFDQRRFLPPGYDFTDKGANPGTLSIKIDSETEINQIVWGIKNVVNVEGAKALTYAIYNAVAESIDPTEIREARMVLALPDNNIPSLNFTIDPEGKIRLISSAEETTQEFLENHVNTAYSIKTYNNLQEWLTSLDVEEIDNLIMYYTGMLRSTTADKDLSDPNNPSRNELSAYIEFLEKYFSYRRALKHDPAAVFATPYPENHINLKIARNESGWDDVLCKEMNERIQTMARYIHITDMKLHIIHNGIQPEHFTRIPEKLHDEDLFEEVKKIAGHIEYRNVLEAEKSDLEMKLGKKNSRTPPETFNPNLSDFINYISGFPKTENNSSALNTIIKQVNVYHPVLAYQCNERADNILFTIDLRKHHDFQVFLIACILFMNYRDAKEHTQFITLFSRLYPGSPSPTNLASLSSILGLRGVNLLVSAYQIEQLIHYFATQEQPKKKHPIDLDRLFGTTPHCFWHEKRDSSEFPSIAMQSFFKTAPHHANGELDAHLVKTEEELQRTLDTHQRMSERAMQRQS